MTVEAPISQQATAADSLGFHLFSHEQRMQMYKEANPDDQEPAQQVQMLTRQTLDTLLDGNMPMIQEESATRTAQLREEITQLRETNSVLLTERGGQVAQRYHEADERAQQIMEQQSPVVDDISRILATTTEGQRLCQLAGIADPSDVEARAQLTAQMIRAAMRLSSARDGLHYITDVDGTVTDDNGYYGNYIPGTRIGDPHMDQHGGREAFAEAYPLSWQRLQEEYPEAFTEAAALVPIRPGAAELFQVLRDNDVPTTVLSAGMEPLIEGVMARIEGTERADIQSIRTDSVASNYKVDVITYRALNHPDTAVVFAGDGGSDKPLACPEMANRIAFCMALGGGSFQNALQQEEMLHFPYEDHHDTRLWLQMITDIQTRVQRGQSTPENVSPESWYHVEMPQPHITETQTYADACALIEQTGLTVVDQNTEKPWGAYLVVDPTQTEQFAARFFPDANIKMEGPMQPKMLIVGACKQLSEQFHHLRSERWHIVQGPVAVQINEQNEEPSIKIYEAGDVLHIEQGQVHRLIGLNDDAIVAEIWEHTDPYNLSTEDDIVRTKDIYGR
jgi:2-hydroxy-3-keto-5-methylthiopentenyl-1-phosphate phosphatase/mannose-6-phosphate isomerase-like protein (cupin superfamily)